MDEENIEDYTRTLYLLYYFERSELIVGNITLVSRNGRRCRSFQKLYLLSKTVLAHGYIEFNAAEKHYRFFTKNINHVVLKSISFY